MTEELFREDSYLRECEATVLESAPGKVVLDRTVFYPMGGGQPGDTGLLLLADGSELPITNTLKDGDAIAHLCDEGAALPAPGDKVTARIDWDRRYLHMRMHSCMHLLCAAVPCGVTGGQIGAEKSRLDFDIGDHTLDKEQITAELNRLIGQDLPHRWITDDELDANPELVRTMSVQPPRGSGRIRLMEVEGTDLQPCGGTHVARTGEIGRVAVSKIENKGKRNRRVNIVFA
jgi:misacylated tRNA(Ala) deacylase